MKSRQLSIEIGSLRSQYFAAKVGLPQGSVFSPILFIFFVYDIFKKLNCKKFKLAGVGNLVTGDIETQVCLNCHNILKQLEQWCKNWRVSVSGDKTSIIYINSEKMHASEFLGDACKVTRNTKILCLTIIIELNFSEHLQQVGGIVAKQLNLIKKFCSS